MLVSFFFEEDVFIKNEAQGRNKNKIILMTKKNQFLSISKNEIKITQKQNPANNFRRQKEKKKITEQKITSLFFRTHTHKRKHFPFVLRYFVGDI